VINRAALNSLFRCCCCCHCLALTGMQYAVVYRPPQSCFLPSHPITMQIRLLSCNVCQHWHLNRRLEKSAPGQIWSDPGQPRTSSGAVLTLVTKLSVSVIRQRRLTDMLPAWTLILTLIVCSCSGCLATPF